MTAVESTSSEGLDNLPTYLSQCLDYLKNEPKQYKY